MTRIAAILAGAALFVWPALINGFPILFSDTHAFLVQAGDARMIWDKPFAYGVFLHIFKPILIKAYLCSIVDNIKIGVILFAVTRKNYPHSF